MPISDYAGNKVNDLLYGNTAMNVPDTYYLALLTAAPDGSGTIQEANYGSYIREPLSNNKTNFSIAANVTITNNTEVRFPMNTLGSNTITHIALMDAATDGNLWAWGALDVSKIFAIGDRPVFQVGSLTFTVD